MKREKLIWQITQIAVGLITIMVFTPLVIPKGRFTPELFGLPYTLWVGVLVYILFIMLIIIGISVHSRIYKEEKND